MWHHESDLEPIEVSGNWLINWERVHDYSLTDGCGSGTSAFLFTVWVFWTLCICVCIHRHTNVCTPDLVKEVPTSFITKTRISLKTRERERWRGGNGIYQSGLPKWDGIVAPLSQFWQTSLRVAAQVGHLEDRSLWGWILSQVDQRIWVKDAKAYRRVSCS